MSSVSLILNGEPKTISMHALSVAVSNWLVMLTEVDCAVSGHAHGSLDWMVDDLAIGSLVIEAKAQSRLEGENFGPEVVRQTMNGLRLLEESGLTPPFLSLRGLRSAQRLVKLIGQHGVWSIEVTNHSERVPLSARSSANIDQLVAIRHHALGSVEGKLEMITVHERRPRFNLYVRSTHTAVRCIFQPELLDQVKANLGQSVIAAGEISYNAKNEPVRVDLRELRRLRTKDELPSIGELSGIDADFTRGVESSAYVRSMRDG